MYKLLSIQSLFISVLLLFTVSCDNQEKESVLYIFASTDVHGAIFDTDPLIGEKNYSSMAGIASYIENFDRDKYILLDNGDNLQGSPAVYYYNFVDTLSGPDDNLFKTSVTNRGYGFSNRTYNFDSAAGIDYIVDISKPDGNKINITAFSDGRPFEPDKKYRVALNSYRGSGGGGHLEHAWSLNNDELDSRLVKSTHKDLRYYMIKWFEENDNPVIETDSNWYIIPGDWISSSKTREYEKLFKEITND